ncbi:MAG: hypothetical protein EX254_08145 [Flavobacteriaceae bacterium]|nr:hypothetical protein [Bacteroidia bacterium]NND11274.1 hypothetical protein [Flavobacteriaceae bacterium]NNL60883.1 hypothetical protein [Flavobacteriaceae bacterium]RZV61266.1 MAG: hypothetical protein EX254_08145 [Flavobacteriaceae bacterium]
MKTMNKYSKFVPYFYFIAAVGYFFTIVNRTEGLTAFPILLLGVPFLWQIIKPNRKLNFTLGITFVCLSSYLIIVFLADLFQISSLTTGTKDFLIYIGMFAIANFVMALWMIRNSLVEAFK